MRVRLRAREEQVLVVQDDGQQRGHLVALDALGQQPAVQRRHHARHDGEAVQRLGPQQAWVSLCWLVCSWVDLQLHPLREGG